MQIKCVYCGVEVEKPNSEVLRSNRLGRPMYCSLACGAKHSAEKRDRKKREDYVLSPNRCKCCNMVLDYEKRNNTFCNQSCAAKVNNVVVVKKKSETPYPTCVMCGGKCSTRKSKFCSTQCDIQYRKLVQKKRIESGEVTRHNAIRKYLINIRGPKCESCGWDKINPKSGKCPIEMEHIDGNHNNNAFSNLKLLCPNCHSLTPTYKGLNRGHGRHERMKRYNNGQSF